MKKKVIFTIVGIIVIISICLLTRNIFKSSDESLVGESNTNDISDETADVVPNTTVNTPNTVTTPTVQPEVSTRKWTDIAYATKSSAQKMDIYLPSTGNGPFPVIIQIHGGAFKSGDKASSELTPVLEGLNRGYAVIAVNYRLSSEAVASAQINDIKAAIRYVRANASKYALNPNKIATWGGSAGGSLSALAGTSGGVKELQDDSLGNADQSDAIQACVDWFGPIYFTTMDAEFKALNITPVGVTSSSASPESKYIGKTIGTSEAEALVLKASAQNYISSDDPAFFIQHGTADKNIPITQSINFSTKLKEVLGSDKVIFESIAGAGHGTSQFQTATNTSKVLDFLDKYMK